MNRPDPSTALKELALTTAKALRFHLSDDTRGADDHTIVQELEAAIRKVEVSEVVAPEPPQRDGLV